MYRSDINRELTALSLKHKLKESKGKAAVNEILDELKKNKKKTFCIDRAMIAGSAGKKTALENSNFDCVVFINDFEDSKRPAILKELGSIVSENKGRIEKITQFSVQFKLGGFDVDLLPAGNFVTGAKNDTAKQQEEAVQALIQKDPSKWYRYSAALAESQVGFMEKQSSFVHELVILCKYWNKSVDIPGKVSGRSTLIELIAVHAGQEVERNYNKMYDGFLKFLLLMEDFSSLRICFDSSGNSVPISSQTQIKFTPPFVIEPANPYNNWAKHVNSAQICAFKAKASETRGRLERAQYSRVSIESIFA